LKNDAGCQISDSGCCREMKIPIHQNWIPDTGYQMPEKILTKADLPESERPGRADR
jgi:hypothetical protein